MHLKIATNKFLNLNLDIAKNAPIGKPMKHETNKAIKLTLKDNKKNISKVHYQIKKLTLEILKLLH